MSAGCILHAKRKHKLETHHLPQLIRQASRDNCTCCHQVMARPLITIILTISISANDSKVGPPAVRPHQRQGQQRGPHSRLIAKDDVALYKRLRA